jgi:hypothetical protein
VNFCERLCSALTSNMIFGCDFAVLRRGRIGWSSSQPVSAHQMHSKRKVFPRLLSPVIIFSLSLGSYLSRLEGSTHTVSSVLSAAPDSGSAPGGGPKMFSNSDSVSGDSRKGSCAGVGIERSKRVSFSWSVIKNSANSLSAMSLAVDLAGQCSTRNSHIANSNVGIGHCR